VCIRYSIAAVPDSLQRLFKFSGSMPVFPPRYNVAPTQFVPIVRMAKGKDAAGAAQWELVRVRWGLIPSWDRGDSTGYTNARAERITEKPAFRAAFRTRRCLVPADGFYEWQRVDGQEVPWRITLADGGAFAFAGLWERWDKSSDGVPVESCTIITTAANELVEPISSRMPVILSPGSYEAWLQETRLEALVSLLHSYPAEQMTTYRVNTAVNSVMNDGPECAAPTRP
jgi:putative SOS response-associated peptidase YedK